MSVPQLNNRKYTDVVAAVLTIVEAERQFRDVKSLIDRSLDTAQKFWPLVPALVAGWAFMVSDEERFAVLEGIADQVVPLLPMERLERWLVS
jgi:hypothetical protein